VRSAIDSLGEPDREIVRLAHLEGRSQEEISERLGMPVGTVKSRTHRAMRKLANRLAHLRDRGGSGEPDRRSARTEGEADDG
jgi:RNA polymerase sigma-70 factor (ECF subfamily)